MGPLALFGITNDGLNLAVSLLVLFLIAIWIALIWWTYMDARRRVEDPLLVGCATAASLFPYVGTMVYMIVRPPEYLVDVRERELEIAAAEARLSQVEQLTCPYCDFDVEKSFLRCPSCLRRLKEPCQTCGKPLDPRWKICPYCESEIGQPSAQPRRTRRPASTPAAQTPAARPSGERPAARPSGERPPARPPAERAAPRPSASMPQQRPSRADQPAVTRSQPRPEPR